MSKQSAKQRYEQLKGWLETRNVKSNKTRTPKVSRLDYYNSKGVE